MSLPALRRNAALVLAAACLAAAASPGARAAGPDVIIPELPRREVFTEAQFQQAKGYREAAGKHYDKGRLAKALLEASRAFQTYPNASTSVLRAVILAEMKRHREAFEAYLVALNLEPDEAQVELILKGVAAHASATQLAVISAEPTPGEARVTVDGAALPARVSSVGVPAGQHAVRFEADGYRPADRAVEALAGDIVRVKVSLEQADEAPAAPPAAAPAPPPAPAPAPASGGLSTAGWALIGSGAALVVGGGVFLGLAFSDRGGLEDLDPALGPVEGARQYQDLTDSMETHNAVAWILAGVGAAAVVGGVVALTLDGGDDAPASRGTLQPAATFGLAPLPGGAAAHASWSF